ncbi:MAG: hypothetical protein WA269_11445 [Candidatus Udaeobacter sp.]
MQISPQCRFDRMDEMLIHIETCNQSARQRRFDSRSIMQTLEHSLRPFGEAFPLFVKLTKNFKARSFLGLCPFNAGKLFFYACDKLLLLSPALVARLKSRSTVIDFVLVILCRRARNGDLPLDAAAFSLYRNSGGI